MADNVKLTKEEVELIIQFFGPIYEYNQQQLKMTSEAEDKIEENDE